MPKENPSFVHRTRAAKLAERAKRTFIQVEAKSVPHPTINNSTVLLGEHISGYTLKDDSGGETVFIHNEHDRIPDSGVTVTVSPTPRQSTVEVKDEWGHVTIGPGAQVYASDYIKLARRQAFLPGR